MAYIKHLASMPAARNAIALQFGQNVPAKLALLNVAMTVLWQSMMMAIFIEPDISSIPDNVIDGKVNEGKFRKAIIWLVENRHTGRYLPRLCSFRRPASLLGLPR
ncbi:MAG TPA: DUF2837 family protein [Noviherbaspirillum sp.]|nr:DUF2837 family protein [Noviherbaspirillum sp.]